MTAAFLRSRLPLTLVLGLLIIAVVAIAALFGPWIAPYDPMAMAPKVRLSPPSLVHPFGTDEFGRDLLSRVIVGARSSLGIGLVAVTFALLAGCTIGLVAAFAHRSIEVVVLRVVDVLYSFPDMLIALALMAFLGPGLENATLAIAVGLTPFYARMTYSFAAVERGRPYVDAARLAGIGDLRLVRVHVMPNIIQGLVVMASLGFSSAILSAAGLSFLGLGVQPPSPEWGAILASGRNYISRAPWILFFPGLAICLTVLSFNLVGDSLRDLTDVRWRGGDRT